MVPVSSLQRPRVGRRAMLRAVSLAAVAATGTALLTACGGTPAATTATTAASTIARQPAAAPTVASASVSSATATTTTSATTSASAAAVVATSTPAVASPSSEAAPQAPAGQKVGLVESSWADATHGLSREQARIDLFKQTYPNAPFTVALNNFNKDYQQQLVAQLAGGVGPDVFRLAWENVFPLKEQGALAQVDSYFATMGKDDWLAGADTKKEVFDTARYQGKLYGLPMGSDMSNVEINRSLFRTPGVKAPPLTYDTSLWSFDDVLQAARALTKRAADGTLLQVGISGDSFLYSDSAFSLVESWGGQTLSDDWSKFLWAEGSGPAAWEWVADLVRKYQVTALPSEAKSPVVSYTGGTLAMQTSNVSALSYHIDDIKDKFDWDQAPWPKQGTNPVKVMFEYGAWAMNAQGKHLDDAFQLLQFISGPVGTVPGVELGFELPLFKSLDSRYNSKIAALGKNVKPALDGFQHRIERNYYSQPRWSEAWTKFIAPAMNDIYAGKKSASDAMTSITPQVNGLLLEGAKLMGTA